MKTIMLKSILVLVLMVGFNACTSDEETTTSDETQESVITDVVLTYQQSVSCSDENTFYIEPSSGTTPDITFLRDTTTGVTTITYNSVDGSATVVGCKQ